MAKAKLTLTRKKILLGAGAGLLIAVAGLAVWTGLTLNSEDTADEQQVTEDIQVRAAEFLNAEDAEGGLDYYDEQIETEQDADERQLLLLHKSSFALMAKRYDEAIDAAKQADEMGSSPATTRALAEVYAASGDKEQAIVYYKKLLEAPPSDDEGLRRGPSIEDIIKGLEQ